MVQVTIKTMEGRTIELTFKGTRVSVRNVREEVCKILLVPLKNIKVLSFGKILEDDEYIIDHNLGMISSTHIIHIEIPVILENEESVVVYINHRSTVYPVSSFKTIQDFVCCIALQFGFHGSIEWVNSKVKVSFPGSNDPLESFDYPFKDVPQHGKKKQRIMFCEISLKGIDSEGANINVTDVEEHILKDLISVIDDFVNRTLKSSRFKEFNKLFLSSKIEENVQFKAEGESRKCCLLLESFLDAFIDRSKRYDSYSLGGLQLNDFKIGEVLGSGSNGEVFYSSLIMNENVHYAIKKIWDVGSMVNMEFSKEYSICMKYPHENLGRVVTFFEDSVINPSLHEEKLGKGKTTYFLIDMYQKTLKSLLKGNALSERTILLIALQIFKGLEHLKGNNIAHRDLKSSDIMFDQHGNIHIIDFGCATTEMETLTRDGFIMGRAPEILFSVSHQPVDHGSVDVWSTGLILLECLRISNPLFSDLMKSIRSFHCSSMEGRIDEELENFFFHQKPSILVLGLAFSCLRLNKRERITPKEAIRLIEMILWPLESSEDFVRICKSQYEIMEKRFSKAYTRYPFGVFGNVEEKLKVQFLLKSCDSFESKEKCSISRRECYDPKELINDCLKMGYPVERVKKCVRFMRKSSKHVIQINDVLDMLDNSRLTFDITKETVEENFVNKFKKLENHLEKERNEYFQKRLTLENSTIFDFHLIREIGRTDNVREGCEAVIFLCRHISSGDHYVLKVLLNPERNAHSSDRLIERFQNEFEIMSDLSSDEETNNSDHEETNKFFHPNIIALMCVFVFDLRTKIFPSWHESPIYNPLSEGGRGSNRTCALAMNPYDMSLKNYIEKREYDSRTVLDIMIQLADVSIYLESECIIHGDIKPANILIKDEIVPLAVLTDFGMHFWCEDLFCKSSVLYQKPGNRSYSAPEMRGKNRGRKVQNVSKGNIWGFALIGSEMLLRKYPLANEILKPFFPNDFMVDDKFDLDTRKFRNEHIHKVMEKFGDDTLVNVLKIMLKLEFEERSNSTEAWLLLNNLKFGPFNPTQDSIKKFCLKDVIEWENNEILDTHNLMCMKYLKFVKNNEKTLVDCMKKFYNA